MPVPLHKVLSLRCGRHRVDNELTVGRPLRLGHNYVGTEHILLALLELEDGSGVLIDLGLDKATRRLQRSERGRTVQVMGLGRSSARKKRQKIEPLAWPSVSSQLGTPGSRLAMTIR